MVTYLADTNIFIRLYIQDNKKQTKISIDLLKKCKARKLELVVLSEIIPEIEYILKKYYKVDRKTISEHLRNLVSTAYVKIENRDNWIYAIDIYSKSNVDIVDALLYAESKTRNNEVVSFDKDFQKLQKYAKNS